MLFILSMGLLGVYRIEQIYMLASFQAYYLHCLLRVCSKTAVKKSR
jgi:hypothetical protein